MPSHVGQWGAIIALVHKQMYRSSQTTRNTYSFMYEPMHRLAEKGELA